MNSLGHNATPTEIEDLINDIDLDQSGTLDLDGMYAPRYKILFSSLTRSRVHQDDDNSSQASQL